MVDDDPEFAPEVGCAGEIDEVVDPIRLYVLGGRGGTDPGKLLLLALLLSGAIE